VVTASVLLLSTVLQTAIGVCAATLGDNQIASKKNAHCNYSPGLHVKYAFEIAPWPQLINIAVFHYVYMRNIPVDHGMRRSKGRFNIPFLYIYSYIFIPKPPYHASGGDRHPIIVSIFTFQSYFQICSDIFENC
jgi:hypothetical protein